MKAFNFFKRDTEAPAADKAPEEAEACEVSEASAFTSDEDDLFPDDLPPLSDDVERPTRIGMFIVLAGFIGFVVWSALAPLDEGVPLQGLVTVDTKRKVIQHPTGGIIEAVHVREAQTVKAGDILVTLNASIAKAGFESARQRYMGQRALESRLLAEQAGNPSIEFHPELLAERDKPYVAQLMATQSQLFQSRRSALQSELGAIDEAIHAQDEVARGLRQQIGSRQQHLALINDERQSMREMVQEGYAPLNKQRELERMQVESEMQLTDLRSNLAKTQRVMSELRLRRNQREQEVRREIDTQMADIKRESATDEEKYVVAREELDRIQIKAPVDGMVVGIANQTIGGVIPPGGRIMDVVPSDEKLVFEGYLPPHLVDRVRAGQKADVRFSGFAHEPQLVVEGLLNSISADLISDPATNVKYYLVRVALTDEGARQMGKRQIKPGMPVEIVIKTGERSLLTYLLGPLFKRMSQSMIEE